MADTSITPIYFIKPSTSVPNLALVSIILFIGLYIIFVIISMAINWETKKCQGGNFLLAPLYGDDTSKTFSSCAEKSLNQISNNDNIYLKATTDLTKAVDEMDKKLTNLSSAPAASTGSTSATSPSYSAMLTTVDTIQTALSKILGSVVLTANMNNGILQSTNSLQSGELTKLMNKYNSLGKNIQEQQIAMVTV